jgi:hypothetical protein
MKKELKLVQGITQQILDIQEQAYSDRVGKIYGDFEVVDVAYDWEKRKQLWTMRCTLCGEIRKTYNGREYAKGKNSGTCKCRRRRTLEEKIAEKQKRDNEKPESPKWIGMIFGEWKILEYVSGKGTYVECIDCGRKTYHPFKKVINSSAPKCLCKFNYGKYKNQSWNGKKYGHLTITGYENCRFICICDCGEKAFVKPTHLFDGIVKTCGKCEYSKENITTHQMSGHRLYRIWRGMIERCYNPKRNSYYLYGGRGISICDEWKSDLFKFVEWANSHGYSEELSIDRIDGDGNYEPNNCRWATPVEQANNQHPKYTFKPKSEKNVRKLIWTIDGETKSAIEWCNQFEISMQTVRYRVFVKGMSPKEALSKYCLPFGRPRKKLR